MINQYGIKKLEFEVFESSMYYDNNGNLQSAQFTMSPIGIETENGDQLRFGIHRTFDKPVEDFEIFNGTQILARKLLGHYLRRQLKHPPQEMSMRN